MINLRNARQYINNFLVIRTKDSRLVPFQFNQAQEVLYAALRTQHLAGKPMRAIVLKARQLGFSTLTEALIFQRTVTRPNTDSLIIAHREDSTSNLFRMSKRFYENLPEALKPMLAASNAQELRFENPNKKGKVENPGLGSRIRCNTAGGAGIGRSDTLQNLHASEFAFWRGNKLDTWLGAAQAVPALPGTLIVIESTANGFDEFKTIWDDAEAGKSDFVPLFFPWFANPEYTMEAPPDTLWTDEELKLKTRFSLTFRQLAWRRWCIKNNCANDQRRFRQEYPASPDEAFLTSGDPFFDNELVMEQKLKKVKPLRVGEFVYDYDGLTITNIRFLDDPGGCIKIYEEPQKTHPYVLGGDNAGGGPDWFTGFLIDNISGRQCAVLRRQFSEPEYSRQMFCLGKYYNTALLGVEVNFSTYPTLELYRLGYDKLYVRQKIDNFNLPLEDKFGFRTDQITRPVILAQLKELFKNSSDLFCDEQLLLEMLSFCYVDGRPEGIAGVPDDCVMGLAITYGIRGQQRFTKKQAGFSMEGWSKTMKDDYKRADSAEKAHLRKEWGNMEALNEKRQ